MNWDEVISEEVPGGQALGPRLRALFDQQRAAWPALREGEAALASMRTRTLSADGARVIVQANPGRRKSTHAKVDPASVAKRLCFLCPDNMPAEERGLACGPLVVLPNPYPIGPRHCTVPVRGHVPQSIAGNVEALLALAQGLGPDMVAFYNGPGCGASAPDHLHFQACQANGVPLLKELPADLGPDEVRAHQSLGRRLLVYGSRAAGSQLERTLAALAAITGTRAEPMINLLAFHQNGQSRAVLIPRARHRPTQFFEQGPDRIAVSPAALEMAGLLVVAEPEDFEKLDLTAVRDIYSQVSLEADRFDALVEAI